MPCNVMKLPGGGVAIVCTRGMTKKCSSCKVRTATLLCDYPLRGAAEGRTCDRGLCGHCAKHIDGKDYCPAHAKLVNPK